MGDNYGWNSVGNDNVRGEGSDGFVETFYVPSADVASMWRLVEASIADAVETSRGKYTVDDVKADCMSGDAQLWLVGMDEQLLCVTVTRIVEFSRKKVCQIDICVGDRMDLWWRNVGHIEEWARNMGCDAMWCIARKGWARIMKDYDCTHVLLEKDL